MRRSMEPGPAHRVPAPDLPRCVAKPAMPASPHPGPRGGPAPRRNEPEIALRDPPSLAVCGRNPRRNSARHANASHPYQSPAPRIPPVSRPTTFHAGTRSGHAELVALGVAQHDRMASHVFVHPGDAGSRLHELFYLLRHQLLAFLALHLVVA